MACVRIMGVRTRRTGDGTSGDVSCLRVSEHRLGRQSSVLSPWRVPQGCRIQRECPAFDYVSINQFTIFISIDPYIPTGIRSGEG